MTFENGRVEQVAKSWDVLKEMEAIIRELEDMLDTKDIFREDRALHILSSEIAYALHTLREDGVCKDVIEELERRENLEAYLKSLRKEEALK